MVEPGQRRKKLKCSGVLAASFSLAVLLGCGQSMGPGSGSGSGGSGSASQGTISTGAQLGYTWNSGDSSIRPVLGVPGASRLGASVGPTPGAYVTAAIANASGVALMQDGKGNLNVLQLPNGNPEPLLSGIAQPLQFTFSRTGNYAIGYAAGLAQTLVVSGLPSSPLTSSQSAGQGLQGATISDQGSVLLAQLNSTGGTNVKVAASGQAVLQLGGFGGFSFLPGVDTAVIADSIANSLTLLKNVSTQPSTQTVSITASLLNKPFAVQTSADGRWAVVANSGDNSIVRVDLTNVTPAVKVTCPTPVTQLVPWSGNADFALTSPASGPVWMLSAAGTAPRVLFVPALAASTTDVAPSVSPITRGRSAR